MSYKLIILAYIILFDFRWLECKYDSSYSYKQILQQIRSDMTMLTLEDGSSPVRNPSTAAEDARLASLVSLDGILKLVKVCY